MIDVDCVVWDFDGVLNRNMVDGRFVWQEDFERDIRQSLESFQEAIFTDTFPEILRGRIDLLGHVAAWTESVGYAPGAAAILDYWFAKDARPDPRMLENMERLAAAGLQQAIATNNEARRTAYIEQEMGFGRRVEAIFSSGRLGCAKPDREFFDTVREVLGTAAERLLLIDDSAANVAAAEALGWQAFLFRDLDYAGLEARLGLR